MNNPPGKPRLLVIDTPGVADVLTLFLGMAGFDAIAAPSVEAGLAQAGHERPDLILTDACPSGPDGPQLCILLRSVLGDAPVVCLGGHGSHDANETPWLTARILQRIRRALAPMKSTADSMVM